MLQGGAPMNVPSKLCAGLLLALLGLGLSACGRSQPQAAAGTSPVAAAGPARCGEHPWCDTRLSADARADRLLAEMTLEEKISLLGGDDVFATTPLPSQTRHTGTSFGIERLGIPTIYYADGPHGVAQATGGTPMPAGIALAASWDPRLAYRYGSVIGEQARGRGNDVVFAPNLDLVRNPFWGRNMETMGEDPFLARTFAPPLVHGIQDQGVIANAKHFVGNHQDGALSVPPEGFPLPPLTGAVGGRFTTDVVVSERALREIYLQSYEAAVKEGGVGTVMCSYNRLNGPWACENPFTLTQVLREEWGFKGYVLADYNAVHIPQAGLNAGLDFEPWPALVYSPLVVQAVRAVALVSDETINKRVRNILRTHFAFGVFDRAAYPDDISRIDTEGHFAASRSIAEQGMVLMKNDGELLPLPARAGLKLALIGAAADRYNAGRGSSFVIPLKTTTLRQGLEARAAAAGVELRYDPGTSTSTAAALAREADVVIVAVSNHMTEGHDQPCLSLDCGGLLGPLGEALSFTPECLLSDCAGNQDALIAAVAAANPKTMVVMQTGGQVLTPWRDQVPAILEAWYPGADGGTAMARVLFGDVNPSGKLPITFPQHTVDTPVGGDLLRYPGNGVQVFYSDDVLMGYRWYDAQGLEPAFPFGHGLSYTRFRYSDLQVNDRDISATVANIGTREGAEVAQLYLGLPQPAPGIVQPPHQLKGFQKVQLSPGESARVHFALDARSFAYWDEAGARWSVAPGCYGVAVGSSSRALPLQGVIAQAGGNCP
ncbi:glycosyl hydrolase [Solimonas sp. K1W22B-7]|nr:glycosyl hydrolase [Solimonas sp. K1W22B-7]